MCPHLRGQAVQVERTISRQCRLYVDRCAISDFRKRRLFPQAALLLATEKQYAFCDIGAEILNITGMNLGRLVRLRRLFASLSLLRVGFDPGPLHVRFAVNKATGFSPIT
jgi:hypothetical protein